MVEATNRNLAALGQAPIGILLADAGYYSDANVRALAAAGPAPRRRIAAGLSVRERMRRTLTTQRSRRVGSASASQLGVDRRDPSFQLAPRHKTVRRSGKRSRRVWRRLWANSRLPNVGSCIRALTSTVATQIVSNPQHGALFRAFLVFLAGNVAVPTLPAGARLVVTELP